jgi:hypothetical protein
MLALIRHAPRLGSPVVAVLFVVVIAGLLETISLLIGSKYSLEEKRATVK